MLKVITVMMIRVPGLRKAVSKLGKPIVTTMNMNVDARTRWCC
jgi:hypothetical protein